MHKFILTLLFTIMVGTSALAQPIDTGGLTKAQVAELMLEAENMKNSKNTTLETLNEYGEFGKAFGSAIAETAREIGTTANEFITTPAGKIAVALIVWKVAGDDILGVVLGMLWFTVMIPLWVIFFRKLVTNIRYDTEITTDSNGKLTKTREFTHSSMQERADAAAWTMLFIFVVICIAGFFIFG